MQLARLRSVKPRISLVAMIDVLMIMLVFFMVTSTYLNLDMIPVTRSANVTQETGTATGEGSASRRVLIRLGADGAVHVSGRPVAADGIGSVIRATLADTPTAEFIVLPSGNATTQALVSVMDSVVGAGGTRLRVVRLEANP
jgi:biopolymer transport protein ExbD